MTAIDNVKLYRNIPIQITDKITLTQPKVSDIFTDLKTEQNYFAFVQNFTAITLDSNIMVFLNDTAHIDFTKITNWELFSILCISFDKDISQLFFGNLDWQSMKPFNDENGNVYIENKDGVKITEPIYDLLFQYIRIINNMPLRIQTKILDDDVQKNMALSNARREIQSNLKRARFYPCASMLLPYISSLINYGGYKNEEIIYEMNIYKFWDSINRINAYEAFSGINIGMYSGMVSLKDNPDLRKNLNWMREIKN